MVGRQRTKWVINVIGTLLLALGLGLSLGFVGAGKTTERPIGDFLERQGDLCLTFDSEGNFFDGFYQGDRTEPCDPETTIVFDPLVKNFIGWGDPDANLSASVNYAGLADDARGGSLGTEFEGEVTERRLQDGRAKVKVELETENALTWVVRGSFDDPDAPVEFGERIELVDDEKKIEDPVLGESELEVVFINPEPGAPLPDLVQLFLDPEENQEVKSVKFKAEAESEQGEVEVTQICQAPCDLGDFDVEIVKLELED